MPLLYPIKHVFRNWKLFAALLIGIALAATFFAGIGVKANVASEQSLDKQISSVLVDMSSQVQLNLSNLNLAYRDILGVEGVTHADYIASVFSPVGLPSDNYSRMGYYAQMVSFPNNSRILGEWLNKPSDPLPTNYTYVMAGSDLAKNVKIGDIITTMVTFDSPKYYNQTTFYMNLTVAGFIELTDKGYSLLTGNTYYYEDSYYGSYKSDILVVDWDNTLVPLWSKALDSSTVNIQFYIDVDREGLISPWNVQASVTKIQQIADKIQNQVLGKYLAWGWVNNQLGNSLSGYQSNISGFIMNFAFVAIPILFLSWYLGMTVSDVSYNIRRREIGLLSTKGLSNGQIQRMFLSEAIVIGLVGGLLGVVGGLLLNQYYAGSVNVNSLFTSQLFSPEIALYTIIFAVILSLLSVFFSSRKASRIPAVEALRNDMSLSEKPPRKIFPAIALIIGCYPIVIYLFAIDVPTAFDQWLYTSGNVFLMELSNPISIIDDGLKFFGIFFFLWGFTKLVIRDSTKFQTAVTKIASVMGDLGALAAKNVRRNPARLAALAFIVALVMALGVQVSGQIASQEDYIVRDLRADVGADIFVNLANATEGQIVLNQLLANVSSIQNATVERILNPPIDGGSNGYYSSTIRLRTIDPTSWALSAYYEDGWFSGNNLQDILKMMKADNNTIVVSRTFAKQYDWKLYDKVTINFESVPRMLKIVGFFGPEPTGDNTVIPYRTSGTTTIFQDASGKSVIGSQFVPSYYYGGSYDLATDCFAPRDLFNVTGADSDIYQIESFSTNILIKLKPGVDGAVVAQQIRDLDLDINTVVSFDEEWQSSTEMNNLSTYTSLQTLDFQSFGLIFAVISASVGTALIAIVSLKERSREATLMSVRGLSLRQLIWMFITESMSIITFAAILGIVVGVIIVYGTVAIANNSMYTMSLVSQRLIFPADAVATIGTYAALIYASTIGAIIIMSIQYVTKLEKMVRTR
ncbi:MAG: FtsX-like permease family protein [Candidatus Bathyarchaeota archaeon]|nr:FtsX-like permease family protein [Candidatus Bathyarchaeota archaeon]